MLCENVVKVRRVSDRQMTAVAVVEEDVLKLICGHALRNARNIDEKQSFYDEKKCEWDMHSAGDFVMCLGD